MCYTMWSVHLLYSFLFDISLAEKAHFFLITFQWIFLYNTFVKKYTKLLTPSFLNTAHWFLRINNIKINQHIIFSTPLFPHSRILLPANIYKTISKLIYFLYNSSLFFCFKDNFHSFSYELFPNIIEVSHHFLKTLPPVVQTVSCVNHFQLENVSP